MSVAALKDLVERKRLEKRGFSALEIFVEAGLGSPEDLLLRFDGRRLGEALLGRGPGQPEDLAEAFQTKAGES